jgi:putative sterol carrier protein
VPIQFLSDEWLEGVKQGLNESDGFRKGAGTAKAKLQQVVTGTPDGERRYWIAIEDGHVDIGPGDVEQPDVTITQDYQTAAQMARSEINPVSAFMTGKLKINGSMTLLMQLQGAIGELPKVMEEMDVDY